MKKNKHTHFFTVKATAIAVAASVLAGSAFADTVSAVFPTKPRYVDNVFTRMFPLLPPFAPQTDLVRQAVGKMGAAGGIMDAKDNLSDPILSITNPAVYSPLNFDNPSMTAGVTFLGQFLDHDITLDKKSELGVNAQPNKTINFRTSLFDLDSVYGDGPSGSPALYDTSSGRIKFVVRTIPGSENVSRNGAVRYDLPRDANGIAIIGDSRNDENIVISQFHLAMLKFHNAVTDYLASKPEYAGATSDQLFQAARQLVTWHYQWIILNEFLPTTIGQDRVNAILTNGLQYYKLDTVEDFLTLNNGQKLPRLPIEFSVAAYRFGHSQVRPSYRVNFGPTGGSPFFAFIFDDKLAATDPDPNDMRGGKPAARRFVDWQTFFNFGDGNFRPNKLIDTKLSTPLMILPGARGPVVGLPDDGVQSLASRNLIRHVNFGIPSGQAIAKRMKLPVLTPSQLSELAPYSTEGVSMSYSTPLWYYILKEAEVMENGRRLGPVGSNIVGEVFIGLLKRDPNSYLSTNPAWKPTLPSATAGAFRVTDLLKFAGVVPAL